MSQLGQYFTTNDILRNKVFEFILNNPDVILEPSVGKGHLIQTVHNHNDTILFDMYEIDRTVQMLDNIPNNVIYCDFIKHPIKNKYNTIIGNPPFVRTIKGNLYIDFIYKCYHLLNPNGELIFIVPSDFFKLTSASSLLNTMIENGTFTHIYHPNKENLFENATIDVLVFRYCKNNKLDKKVLYNNKLLYLIHYDGLVTFQKNINTNGVVFKDYFDIYVGLVSGKDNVYKNKEYGNIEILNGENQMNKYIFIHEFPCQDDKINQYLLSHKNELIHRKIKKFNDKNWFEWGAPRNMKSIQHNFGKDCIYMYNLTRRNTIAFKDTVKYFGGTLILLIPKENINMNMNIDINKILIYLNSNEFKQNFMFSGRFKIGHRQISNSYIPSHCL